MGAARGIASGGGRRRDTLRRESTYEKTTMIAAARVFGEEETVFRRLLSSLGVGGARVDTRLGAESFVPGGPVSGEVYTIGDDAQGFNRTYLCVINYKHEDSTHSTL